ncbi:C2 domain, Formin, FH2 domain, Protein-tyrosine phosphatase-like protein [Artemisia annua]|uniref:Formin-like protein n=1 Tax=Artemisia annua TaxID=35608 RepID=A0A2U1M9M5_ARTAN|nr:C2 domain, Formin, FH2 domain, Protein-tyrosine phosphatase-like protein [Artemisia annua]
MKRARHVSGRRGDMKSMKRARHVSERRGDMKSLKEFDFKKIKILDQVTVFEISERVYGPPPPTQISNLNPLHWRKVTKPLRGSLWEELQRPGESQSAPDFDVSEFETLFSAVVSKKDTSKGEEQRKSTGSKTEKIHLVDVRRANNTEIMLTKIQVPLPNLMDAALAMDESLLDADQVEHLIKFCPTKEEKELLQSYAGDKEMLGKCEQVGSQFFLELMKVPRVESKLRVFLFKIQFNTQLTKFKKSLNTVKSACEEIRTSRKLKEIMKTILYMGNTLNKGTVRGAALGFRLDSLLKLTDARASNSQMTLMHYLCKVLAAKSPALLDFHMDLVSLESAAEIQLKSLAEEIQAFSKGLEKVPQELTASADDGPLSEVFCKKLSAFLGFAESEVLSVANLYSLVVRNADVLALYFNEDPARCHFEQVSQTLWIFVRHFRKEVESKQDKEEGYKLTDGKEEKSEDVESKPGKGSMSRPKERQHLVISLREIEVATKSFKECIGKGGYGLVYKGKLDKSGKIIPVAIKRLNEQFGQGLKEFLTEVHLLSGQKHPNLISLVGYCEEDKEKILVYEYAQRGSLDKYLRRNTTTNYTLTWHQRLKICVGAARGLEHLHYHVGEHLSIIHRDIKSANILLDQNWVAKVSDFGLSKLTFTGLDRSTIASLPCGTISYIEPEYMATGILKKKSDVYSFGMVLFEVLCGRLCTVKDDDGILLSGPLAKEFYERKRLDEIVDPSLKEHLNSDSMNKFSEIAYRCLHYDRKQRPRMDLVVKELENLLKIEE